MCFHLDLASQGRELIMQRFATLAHDYLGHENGRETLMCIGGSR